ncbi:MAG TPA: DUF2007 domain-containing protein [Pseudomonas xinjiangensis]|uniref:DUF2007 domain-containing protein n=2 Tax=root TaxID=1 RepID=A0A7V1BP45_9GAMM|nr:DUF2007 domain-containing protein [Halopseudomonas xinjiangensis]HEC46297.1 DUF2007 domain-containing protein [Halopseudomonas xinjiangensis]
MLCAYEPADLAEAELLKQVLWAQHIRCHISGQYLQGAMGELPVHGLLGLWVHPDDLGLAHEVIDSWQKAEPMVSEDDEQACEPPF